LQRASLALPGGEGLNRLTAWANLPYALSSADVTREAVTLTARLLTTALILMPTASAISAADEANYPSRQIRIVVGFAAGGAPDALARIVSDRLAQKWGQAVLVENRTGANGNIAMAAVAKSPPDGYTLALVPVGNAAVNPSLFTDLPYEIGQFAPITQLANVENVLVISAKSPIKSLESLIALGRAKGANLTYATPGAGSIAHLAAELLARSAGFTDDPRHLSRRHAGLDRCTARRGHHDVLSAFDGQAVDCQRRTARTRCCQRRRLQRRATCPGSKPCPGTP
jgi:tripartite-type tricarboxylate transporter receptor subunit TctC